MPFVLPEHAGKVVRVWDARGCVHEGKCIGVNALGQRDTMKIQFVDKDGIVRWKIVGTIKRVDIV